MARRPGSRTRSISLDNSPSWPSYGRPTKRPRRVSLPLVKDEPSDVNSNGSGREEYGSGKVLLRDWLLLQANEDRIPGLKWIMEDGERYLKIPWIHGSKASWTIEDCKVFESWAKYTGKFWSSPRNPKKWKANFRCAINSLPDVEEMKSMGCKSGTKAFKVYKFLPEQPRKHRIAAELKRRTIIPSTHSLNSPSSSPVSCISKSLEVSTEIKTEFSAEDDGGGRSNGDPLLSRRLSSPIDDVSSVLSSSSSSSSSVRLPRRLTPVSPPSSTTNPKDVDCTQETSPPMQRSPGLLPLYVTQMSVDDDNDNDDDDIDDESNYLPCIVENEADSSEDDDNDNDGDDDDDDNGSRHTFLEFCDRRENHSPRKVFSRASSTSVSESWFSNSNQHRPATPAAPNCASSSRLTSHEIETSMVETSTTTLASFIPTSSVSSASAAVSLSDNSSPLHLATALESGIELLEMPEIPDFDSPGFADMLDVDWFQ